MDVTESTTQLNQQGSEFRDSLTEQILMSLYNGIGNLIFPMLLFFSVERH